MNLNQINVKKRTYKIYEMIFIARFCSNLQRYLLCSVTSVGNHKDPKNGFKKVNDDIHFTACLSVCQCFKLNIDIIRGLLSG